MPHSLAQAKPHAPEHARRNDAWLASPRRFALWVMGAYVLLCLPLLAIRHFDPSVFVVAGDRYVHAAETNPRLRVKVDSNGYDGQFYYRMAVHPFSTSPREDGIAFDHPGRRLSRMFYSLLVWLASFGQARAAAWAMLGVNIAGMGALAWCGADLARRRRLPSLVPLAIVLWPGFIVTMTHDTAEIVAAALVVAAVSAWLDRRLLLYMVLAGCAALTRETTLPIWAGLAAYAVLEGPIRPITRSRLCLVLSSGAPFVPFFVLRAILSHALREAPEASGLHDLGWPFVGGATMVWQCLTGARRWASTPLKDALERGYVLLSAVPLMAFYVGVAARLRRVASDHVSACLAAAWLGSAVLMSLLAAAGPWIDPTAYLRAFTECYVVGCLVVGATGAGWRASWVAAAGGVQVMLAWAFCMIQLR